METESITLAQQQQQQQQQPSPPTIHVGPITSPISNETISIVIPLSSQLTARAEASQFPLSLKMEASPFLNPSTSTQSLSKSDLAQIIQKADKTKGCPFPTCSRYGRAFSRAHDLKRHIARHETRKERLCDPVKIEVKTCTTCGDSFINDFVLQRHMKTHVKPDAAEAMVVEGREFSCHLCKKKYAQLSKLHAHIATHNLKTINNMCALCGNQCDSIEHLEEHMKEHTKSILQAQEALAASVSVKDERSEDDDGFLLEEMLLINKRPHLITPPKSEPTKVHSDGKIRCDYCQKTFKTKWTLSSHVAAHEGRFQFACSRCGKKFVRKSHYDGHVRSHEAARPYACEQCGKTFKELKHRREHTKRKHPSNRSDVQNLLDSISAYVAEESAMEQPKLTLLMPMNFTT